MIRHGCIPLILFLSATLPGSGGEPKDKKAEPKDAAPQVYRKVPDQKLEELLDSVKLKFQKTAGAKGVTTFEFEHQKRRLKLMNYNGEDLWVESLFADKLPLAKVNQWNTKAKYSRGVFLKGKEGEEDTVSLEAQLDCVGGVTDGMIRQFLRRFIGDLDEFVKFIGKTK